MGQFPTTPSFSLAGKRALVAGASSGIGRACAVALAEAGAHVTLAARRAEVLAEIAEQMAAENWQADTLAMDVVDVEATGRLVAENGTYDILVNSAGLARHDKATDTTAEDFDAAMEMTPCSRK